MIHQPLDKIEESFLPALSDEFQRIRRNFSEMHAPDLANYWHAAHWCHQHLMIPQGVALLLEGVISAIVDCFRGPLEQVGQEMEQRNFVSSLLTVVGRMKDPGDWHGSLAQHLDLAVRIRDSIMWDFAMHYASLNETRNDCLHAGHRGSPSTPQNLRQQLESSLETLKPLFFSPHHRCPPTTQGSL